MSIRAHYKKLLNPFKDMPEETVISTMLLRSMQQAKYFEESLGHFGLSTEFYTHFTAPIRTLPGLNRSSFNPNVFNRKRCLGKDNRTLEFSVNGNC